MYTHPALLGSLYDDVSGHNMLSYIGIGIDIHSKLVKGADQARGDDASTLKSMVVTWLTNMFGTSVPPLLQTAKDGRGFHNVHTGRLLCPGEFNWDDEE